MGIYIGKGNCGIFTFIVNLAARNGNNSDVKLIEISFNLFIYQLVSFAVFKQK